MLHKKSQEVEGGAGQPLRDLSDRLAQYLPYAELAATPLPLAPQMSLMLLDSSYPQHLLNQEQIRMVMDYPAYWCFCWASGQVMAKYILQNPTMFAGKRVIDFGCGSAVAGIAAAMAGATEVVACDLDADALAVSRINAELNGVKLEYSGDFFADDQQYDIILVADVLYDKANLPLLALFLQRAKQVLVADSRVRDFSVDHYRHIGFERATTIPDLAESDEFSRVNLYLGERP